MNSLVINNCSQIFCFFFLMCSSGTLKQQTFWNIIVQNSTFPETQFQTWNYPCALETWWNQHYLFTAEKHRSSTSGAIQFWTCCLSMWFSCKIKSTLFDYCINNHQYVNCQLGNQLGHIQQKMMLSKPMGLTSSTELLLSLEGAAGANERKTLPHKTGKRNRISQCLV